MRKLFSVLVVSALMLTGLTGCESSTNSGTGNSAEGTDTIKIGAIFELSGSVASYGTSELEGVKLAVEEINAAGGVKGKQLEIVEADTKSEEAEASSVATKLATQDGVVAIIGPATSGATKASIPAANDAKVPLISPSATDDETLKDASGNTQPYAFRICFQDSFQGITLANFAEDNLNAKKAVILSDSSSDYAVGLSKSFKSTFSGDIVAEENYTKGDTDFNAILTNIKNKDFDVLFVAGYYEEASLIIKQARALGITAAILGADGFDSPELVNIAGENALHDVYYSAHYSALNTDEKSEAFEKAFVKKYDKEPNAFNALAYDAVYMLVDAMERADELTSEKIMAALESTTDFKGVTGAVAIDDEHNAIKSVSVIKLTNGEQVECTVVNP